MRGNSIQISFLAGERVLSKLAASLRREAQLTAAMSAGPEEFLERWDKTAGAYKALQKASKVAPGPAPLTPKPCALTEYREPPSPHTRCVAPRTACIVLYCLQ